MNCKNILKALLVVSLVFPLVCFILGSVAFLLYMYWYQDFDEMPMPVIDPEVSHIILLAHGLGDTTSSWADPLQRIYQKRNPDAQVIALEWNPYSRNTFRCSIDGMRIGEMIGNRLISNRSLQSLHLVGHSCGSFVVYGLCKAVREQRSDILIQTTFLDPVAIYGGLFWNYGIDHFGDCADFSDAYIDTEDGVPGSNQLLPHAHTFDVTKARKAKGFTGTPHVWPTYYYRYLVESGQAPEYSRNKSVKKVYPKGVITVID